MRCRLILAFALAGVLPAGFAAEASPKGTARPPTCSIMAEPPEQVVTDCTNALADKRRAPKERASLLESRGHALYRLEKLDAALADFDAAIKLDPQNSSPHNRRGITLRKKGEYEQAIESYNAAIKLNPNVSSHFLNRGIAFRFKRDYDKALADMNTLIRMKPAEARGYNERAIIYRLRRDFTRARADHDKAISLDSTNWLYFSERALTSEAAQDFPSAITDIRKAASIDPGNVSLTRSLARLEARLAQQTGNTKPSTGGSARVALIIGNSQYRNVPPLTNPKSDAEILSKALTTVGFNRVDLKLDLTREQLAAALKDFATLADRAEWAVIYYAGHGIEVAGTNYLVPIDARLKSDRDTSFEAISLDQLLRSVEGASKLKLVILDACRDNPFASTMTRSLGTRSLGRGLGNIEPEGATLVAYAAKHGQTALDGSQGNSPFASALARAILTPGLEINLVFRKVRDDVLSATNRKQEPFTYGSLPSEAFYFRK
ncbi:MAG: caspase family protein [Pseudomonadota bacterium]